MNFKAIFLLPVFFFFAYIHTNALQAGFDKADFYKVLESGKINEIDFQLGILNQTKIAEKEAYTGALLMKKAGMITKSKDKLDKFKKGRSKLESSISNDNSNVEYRFLRLIIQENAPKQAKYHNDIDKDSKMIRSNYKSLSSFMQSTIIDYSKKSKALTSL